MGDNQAGFEIILYTAGERRGAANNAKGFKTPHYIKRGDIEAVENVVSWDNCPAEYWEGYRTGDKFKTTYCILADTDNSHSDDPAEWVTHENIKPALPGIRFYTYPSRNNIKPKDGKTARPKEHHIFPVDFTMNVADYTGYMKWLIETFPALHFDPAVSSPAQLNFGVEGAKVEFIDGDMNLTAFRKAYVAADSEKIAPLTAEPQKAEPKAATPQRLQNDVIPQGRRNITMSNFAGRVLIRLGDTEKARAAFEKEAAKCQPPLDGRESETIYNSAVKFFHAKKDGDPAYIEPADYSAAEFDETRRLDAIKCKYDPLYVSVTFLPYAGAKYSERKTCRLSDYQGDSALITRVEVLPVEENMILLLRHYGLKLKFNVIRQTPEVWNDRERQGTLQFAYSQIRDFCDKQELKVPVNKFEDMLLSIARKTPYNPFEIYLKECGRTYDGADYITAVSDTLKSTLPDEVKRKYIAKFLLQIAYVSTSNEGDDTAQHFMLVLKGKQGDGKSTWLSRLLPKWAQRKNYILPGRTCEINNKDHILEQATAVLVEWAELAATFRKSDNEAIKAHVTKSFDRLRPPYFKEAIDIKRRSCLCATVNDEEFLRDATGDRRHTVIPCTDVDYKHNVNIDGLWGQVWRMREQGAPYWYSKEEIAEVLAENAQHRVKTELQVALENLFDLYPAAEPKRYLYAKDIIEEIGRAQVYGVHTTPKSVTQTLNSMGVKSKTVKKVATFGIEPINTFTSPPPLGRGYNDFEGEFLK